MSSLTGDSNNFFMQAMMGYRVTKALLVANRLGVFDAIHAGARTAVAIADTTATNAAKLELLLRVLVGLGLLQRVDGEYSLMPIASTHLLSSSPDFVGNNLRFQDLLWDNWSHLEDVVRDGKAWRGLGELLAEEGQEFTNQYIRGMQNISGPSSRDVARLLGPVKRFVDVGCGPGNYARALLEANAGATGQLLDLATTLAVTEEYMRPFIDAGRCALRVGNYLREEYGSGFDLVLMSHTTHDEDDAGVSAMMERAYRALDSGGRIAIHDWTVDKNGLPMAAALFSLNLGVYTEGRVYEVREYVDLLERAGFVGAQSHGVLEGKVANPTTLVVASKP